MKEIIEFILKGIRMPLIRSCEYPGKDFYIGLCETGIESFSNPRINRELREGYVNIFKDLRIKRIKQLKGEYFIDEVMSALC